MARDPGLDVRPSLVCSGSGPDDASLCRARCADGPGGASRSVDSDRQPIIEYPAFGRMGNFSRPESGRDPWHGRWGRPRMRINATGGSVRIRWTSSAARRPISPARRRGASCRGRRCKPTKAMTAEEVLVIGIMRDCVCARKIQVGAYPSAEDGRPSPVPLVSPNPTISDVGLRTFHERGTLWETKEPTFYWEQSGTRCSGCTSDHIHRGIPPCRVNRCIDKCRCNNV
jgi:hypothetical protein